MLSAGADNRQTSFLLSLGKFGSVAAAFVVGRIADRQGLPCILTLCLFATAIAILFTGHLVALPMRADATGWVSGFARLIGGGVGTMAGGYMVQRACSPHAMANALAAPALAAGLIVLLVSGSIDQRCRSQCF